MNKSAAKKYLKESEKRIEAYKEIIQEFEKPFRDLNSANMQATLIQFEDFLDSNHLYAFENWIDGVIWDGPNIRRYWVDITLKYPYECMPNPRAALRLLNIGAEVRYKTSSEWVPIKVKDPSDLDPLTRKPKEKERKIWLVNIRVPRKFIEDAIEDDINNQIKSSLGQEADVEKPKEKPEAEKEIGAEETGTEETRGEEEL